MFAGRDTIYEHISVALKKYRGYENIIMGTKNKGYIVPNHMSYWRGGRGGEPTVTILKSRSRLKSPAKNFQHRLHIYY